MKTRTFAFIIGFCAAVLIFTLAPGLKTQVKIGQPDTAVSASVFGTKPKNGAPDGNSSKEICKAMIGFPDGTAKTISVSYYSNFGGGGFVTFYDTKGHAYQTHISNVVVYD